MSGEGGYFLFLRLFWPFGLFRIAAISVRMITNTTRYSISITPFRGQD